NRMVYTIKTMYYLREEIKKIHPVSILSFGEIFNNLVLLSLWGLHYPIYISDRCRPNKSFGKLHDHLRKWLYPKATGVIAQTEKAKSIYLTQFKHPNIRVIGNPIRKIEDGNFLNKENIVLSVGRLITTKNFDQLIRIFSQVVYGDWKLIIVGGDALKQKNSVLLQKQIDDLGLTDRIILAGSQKDVVSYLLRSKIFAFTSSSEGFPNVIGEALAAGLPVIAYDCIAGPADMVEDGKNGYLIPLFDEEMFKKKLVYLMQHDEVRNQMVQNAPPSVLKYSTSVVCEKYLDFILNNK
ncbi:glycosyltransferase, partial [Butyricimonas virosa]